MLSISRTTDEDVEACVELLSILFAQEAEFEADPARHRAGLRALLARPDTALLYCAREGRTIIGMVSLLLTVSTALGEPVAWLEDLVVAPTARGRGVGTALLEFAIAEARRRGLKRVTLLTDPHNRGAQELYQRFGFTRSEMVVYRRLLGSPPSPSSDS
ncbi:MAG TPA: GNAT family N-acetyltransferase [Gemmatimonadales bacterium]|nr:GNAT family N-acetyltransferase [Gemmatimonadales bacterium]